MRALLLALLLASVAACGGSMGGEGRVEYSVSAKKNYDRGMNSLSDEDWMEAAKYFSFVKARFPYSKYAVLAELRLADTLYGAGQYIEAIDAFKLFIKYHPTHAMVRNGYAAFRIGQSFYKTLPDDFFLLPPSYEKDQTGTRDCLRAFTSFAAKYPDSPYRKQAETMRKECGRRLAEHEWYVATFYWKRERPAGTIMRLERLLKSYPGVGYDEEALWLLGKAYVEVGRPSKAREAWTRLVDRYPKHRRAADARDALKE